MYNNGNLQEAAVHSILINLLGANLYRITPEFCKADAAYGANVKSVMPIQIKTSAKRRRGQWQFCETSGYDDMLLVCKPFDSPEAGFLIFPGRHIHMRHLKYCWGGKHQKYFVPDAKVRQVLQDMSGIPFCSFKDLCLPVQSKQLKAQKLADARAVRLEGVFDIIANQIQGTPVDVVIEGKRVQDKCAYAETGRRGWRVDLKKRAGRYASRPYESNDFDFLWVHGNKTDCHFWLIPAEHLQQLGFFSDNDQKGRTRLTILDERSHWSNCFRFQYSDIDKLQCMFKR